MVSFQLHAIGNSKRKITVTNETNQIIYIISKEIYACIIRMSRCFEMIYNIYQNPYIQIDHIYIQGVYFFATQMVGH